MSAEKRRIRAVAAALVSDGQTIAVAPGTAAQIARSLQSRPRLTVVTNALDVAMDRSRCKDVSVHLTGGYLSSEWFAMVGTRALESIRTMFPAQFFFGANGVHSEYAVTDRHAEESAVNRATAEQAQRRIVVVDHMKFGQIAGHLVCPISKVDVIVYGYGRARRRCGAVLAFGNRSDSGLTA